MHGRAGELAARVRQLEEIRAAIERIEPTEHGALLHLADQPGLEARLRRFTADEKGCCGFWGFDVVAADDEILLRWDAPPGARGLLDRLLALLAGDAPLTEIDALL